MNFQYLAPKGVQRGLEECMEITQRGRNRGRSTSNIIIAKVRMYVND